MKAVASSDERIELLTEAIELYRGDFLPDCYADWALAERERLRATHVSLLEQLVDALIERRQYSLALERAQEMLRFDPLRETTYGLLIRIHALMGDRAAALRVYHTCVTTLQQELGVEPSAVILQLHRRLLQSPEIAPAPAAQQTVQRRRMVGRHAEWEQLLDAWRTAQQREARCVLIWGEAGVGKTRLAEELIGWVQRHGFVCASSRCYAVEGALTYAPVAEWLRAPAIRSAAEGVEDLWQVEVGRLLPELLAERPDLPQPGEMTETWQQQRFYQSIAHTLQRAPAPIALHLDDMQWSDAETLTLLQFLLHGARSHPLLLLGGIRTEDAGQNEALAAFVEALRHTGQLVELRLGPLSKEESAELATQTAGHMLRSEELETLHLTSEGHPLFLIEAVRGAMTDSPAGADSGTDTLHHLQSASAIPSRIYGLLTVRLSQLSPTAHRVATMASVIGRAFNYRILKSALSLDETALIDALDELWQRHIIREQAGDDYDFSHDRIREVAYQQTSRARRRLYHRQVADALEREYQENLDDVCGEIATHFALGGESQFAFPYYRQAARNALAKHALPKAEAMLDAALRHAPDDSCERVRLLQEQNSVFKYSLQFDRWQQNLDEEQALLNEMPSPDIGLSLAHQLSLSDYFINVNEGDRAINSARKALTLARSMDDDFALVSCYQRLGDVQWRLARMADAGHAFRQMTFYARRTGDLVVEGKAMAFESAAGVFADMKVEELLGLLDRSLAIAKDKNDKTQMANIYTKYGYVRTRTGMGSFSQIERDFRRALGLAQETGNRVQESVIWSTLGHFYTVSGDYRQAQKALLAGEEIERDQPELWRKWVTLGYVGARKMQMGWLGIAQGRLAEASDRLAQIGIHHYEVKARLELGLAHHLLGDNVHALQELNHALSLTSDYGDIRSQALANTRLGYALEAIGELADAYRHYVRGRDLHQQMGQDYYAMNALAGLARIASRRTIACRRTGTRREHLGHHRFQRNGRHHRDGAHVAHLLPGL